MVSATGKRATGFSLFELVVSLTIFAVLASVLLARTLQYREDAERQAVQRTVNVLRTALQTRLAKGGAILRPAALAYVLEENPFDWLDQKPVNYLGEYYSPELEEMPVGNWLFDRRDKTLVYLLSSHRNFSFNGSKFLKFKVEFRQAPMTGRKNGPKEVPNNFVIVQVSDQAGTDLD